MIRAAMNVYEPALLRLLLLLRLVNLAASPVIFDARFESTFWNWGAYMRKSFVNPQKRRMVQM